MSYEKVLQAKEIVIGTKQTVKALKTGIVDSVIIAKDADYKLTEKVKNIAMEKSIPIMYVDSMKKLGKACNIKVKAATVAIIS